MNIRSTLEFVPKNVQLGIFLLRNFHYGTPRKNCANVLALDDHQMIKILHVS